MHEATFAQLIIEDVERRVASGEIAGRVVNVCLEIGRLRAVVPDNLVFLFDVLSKGTALEGARLDIESIPICAECRRCGIQFEIEDIYFSCTGCGSPELEILSGDEMLIKSVEVI